jgi:phosphatidylserine/phosphatidylglycerophosphate/cardiolipin synthase-like enzyme
MLTDVLLSYSARLASPESGEGGDPNVRWLQSEPPFHSPLDPARWGPILVRAFDASTVIRSGNAVRHLVDAENPANPALAGYAAMVEAIRSATGGDAFIYLLGWICINDFDMVTCDPTSKLRELLTAAAGRGVQVRAVLWEPSLDRTHTRQNEASARHINSLPGGAAIIDGEHLRFASHHQKLLVVGGGESGLVGFTGGLDVNKDRIQPSTIHCPVAPYHAAAEASYSLAPAELDIESMSGGGGDPLHDVHCRVEGPSAYDLLQTFIRRWDHHPDSRRIEARMPLRGRGRPVPAAVSVPIPPAKSSTGRSCSVAIGRTFNPRSGSGMPCERNIQRGLLAAIGNARRFIYMEDQYLINPEAARALRAALPRIEHLTILLSASEINSDTPCIWTYRREWVHDLKHGLPPALAAKVRIFQLVSPPIPATPPPCAPMPLLRRFLPTFGRHTYVHAKCWMFDDELAVIGSANCNRRGWQHDTEIDAFIFDDRAPARRGERTLAQQMRMDLWAEHLDQPASIFEDGVASAAAWLSPHTSARVVRYCPNEGSDFGEIKCGLIRDTIVDPPAACG